MAPTNGRETYLPVRQRTSYDESVADERERGGGCHGGGCQRCRNSAVSYGRLLRTLAAVAWLALSLSVVAVAMVTVQWAKMASPRLAGRPGSELSPGEEHPTNAVRLDDEGALADPEERVFWSADPTVPEPDCFACRTRRDGRRPAASRRTRTRHRKCSYNCRGTSLFGKNHTTAIHFQGFPPGFYHLEQDGAYVWWRPASWYRHMTGFHYNHSTGHVTIRSSGLYFIYSQMVHTENIGQTYAIVINDVIFLKCTKSAPPTDQSSTYEASCYTAGVIMLHQNDQVWIRGIHTSGRVSIRPESTFWGLIHLGAPDVQP